MRDALEAAAHPLWIRMLVRWCLADGQQVLVRGSTGAGEWTVRTDRGHLWAELVAWFWTYSDGWTG